MPRVLLLVTDLQPGGTPGRIVRMARAMPEFGFEPIVGCLAAEGPLCDPLRTSDIETFACGGRAGWDVRCLWRLGAAIRRTNPDLIHSTLFHANCAARLVGRLDRRRPIITGTATIEIERPMHRRIESWTHGLSDLHIANSEAVKTHLCAELGFSAALIEVIPNAVDLDAIDAAPRANSQELGLPIDVPLIIWAGRMDPVKRLDFLIDVFDRIHGAIPFAALLLGDGPERSRIESRVAGSKLAGVVRFAGWRNDVASWLKSADLLIFPSLTEGSPNVVLEAMAAGCCVMASDIPAHRELMDAGERGQLTSTASIDRFAGQAVELLINPARRRTLIAHARDFVTKQHGTRHLVARLSGVYHRLLANSGIRK